jgi:ATP-dependent DNA ligase
VDSSNDGIRVQSRRGVDLTAFFPDLRNPFPDLRDPLVP